MFEVMVDDPVTLERDVEATVTPTDTGSATGIVCAFSDCEGIPSLHSWDRLPLDSCDCHTGQQWLFQWNHHGNC